MTNIIQNNLLQLKEIHVRTELWKDKIYYISPENYLHWNFPTNNGQKGFLPKPIRFNEILTEWKQLIQEQKEEETPQETIQQAQEQIPQIIQDIKEIIQQEITNEEEEPLVETEAENNQELIQDQEKTKQERIKNLKLGLKKSSPSQFRKFNQEYLEDNEEIENLIQEWEELKKIVKDRKNICFVVYDTQDSFQFCYQPPKRNLPAISDFLWYRNNIWYETTNWIRLNHENALITAKRSYFIHNYLKFIQGGGNGILHNYIAISNSQEVCQCPSFLEASNWLDFFCDWQPSYKLWKLVDMQSGVYSGYNHDRRIPLVHTLHLQEITPESFDRELKQQMLFLMPDGYNGNLLWSKPKFRINFRSRRIEKSILEWAEQMKIKRGMEREHFLRHCVAQFFWNSKLIYTACLDDLDLDNMYIDIKANPSDIMYKFQSHKTFFRWSEDVQFQIDRDIVKEIALDTASEGVQGAIQGAVSGGAMGSAGGPVGAVAGAVSGLIGGLFNMSKGQRKTVASSVEQSLHSQIKTTESKAQDEGQTERKTKYAGTATVASAAIGCLPSILNPSHTKNDYSLAEFALRFNDLNFQMRVEYNQNALNRYSATKQLKRSCNKVFQAKKIGNYLRPGYIKLVPITLERDYHGYFGSILSQGTYVYDKEPAEYYLEPLEQLQHVNASLLQTTTATLTTIEENFSTAIGRDNLVHVDDMSWVWKDSYCRARAGETGLPSGWDHDLFPTLINGMRHNIKRDDPQAWKFDGYSSGQSEATLQQGVQYEWYMHAFSSGQQDSRAFRGLDDGVKVILKQDGADWELSFIGRVEITEVVGNPDAIGSGLGGTENEPETLPEMEDESQTEGLEEAEKSMEPEAEEQKDNDQEKSEELEQQAEPEAQKEDEKQEELEQEEEDEKSKDKQKQKQKQKQKETEQEQQEEAEHSGEQEK